MSNSISIDDRLLRDKTAKCPKCKKGYMKPEFPNHKKIYDYICEKCGYQIHFEPAVIVE